MLSSEFCFPRQISLVTSGSVNLPPVVTPPPVTYDYYMALTTDTPAGNDGNAGTSAAPWATFAHAFTVMSGGQSLFVKAGTYTQNINADNMASGTSFPAGTTKVIGAGIDQTIVNPSTGSGIESLTGQKDNLEFQHMTIESPDGYGVRFYDIQGLRFGNIKIRRSGFQNFQLHSNGGAAQGNGNIVVFDVESVEAGVPNGTGNCQGTTPQGGYCHGFYVAEGTGGMTFDRIKSHDNNGSAMQIYPNPANVTVRNLIGYGNRSQQAGGDPPSGIYLGGTSNKLLNGTLYNNENVGIWVLPSATSASVKNSIAYSNATNLLNNGTGTTLTTNSTDGTNPQFVNAGAGDFHLTASTPASIKNAGTDLTSEGVTSDYDQLARPQGSAYDIGAFEYDE